MAISRASDSSIQDGLPKYNDIWDGTTAVSAFDTLGSVLLNATTSAVTFSNIPQTYTHLHVKCFTRGSSGVVGGSPVYVRVNGDSGTNYSTHQLIGNGSTAYADGHANASYILDGWGGFQSWAGGDAAGCFGIGIIDILDYTNTNKHKTAKAFWGRDDNSTNGRLMLESGSWRNTNAITSLTFTTDSGYGVNWGTNTQFSLYGVK